MFHTPIKKNPKRMPSSGNESRDAVVCHVWGRWDRGLGSTGFLFPAFFCAYVQYHVAIKEMARSVLPRCLQRSERPHRLPSRQKTEVWFESVHLKLVHKGNASTSPPLTLCVAYNYVVGHEAGYGSVAPRFVQIDGDDRRWTIERHRWTFWVTKSGGVSVNNEHMEGFIWDYRFVNHGCLPLFSSDSFSS